MQAVRLLWVVKLKAAFLCCDVSLCLCRDSLNKTQFFGKISGQGVTSQALNAESESNSVRSFCVYVFL